MHYDVVATVGALYMTASSSFLQVTTKTLKYRMSSKFIQIRLLTEEFAALETYSGRNVVATIGTLV